MLVKVRIMHYEILNLYSLFLPEDPIVMTTGQVAFSSPVVSCVKFQASLKLQREKQRGKHTDLKQNTPEHITNIHMVNK